MFLSKCHFDFPWVGRASGSGEVQVVGWGRGVLVNATSAPRRAGGWSGPAARHTLHGAVDVQEQSKGFEVQPLVWLQAEPEARAECALAALLGTKSGTRPGGEAQAAVSLQ